MLKKPAFFSVLAQATAGLALLLATVQAIPASSAAETKPAPTPSPSASPSLPTPREFSDAESDADGDKKGTIGLVCTDALGRVYHADSDSLGRVAFRQCIEEVVASWNVRSPSRWGIDRRSADDKGTIGNVRGYEDLQNTIQRARGSVFPPLNR